MKNTKGKILCGTDFSENAMHAATVAAAVAIRTKEPIVLVNALESLGADLMGQDLVETLAQTSRARLSEEAARLRKFGAKVEEHFAFGSPYVVLSELAASTNARMVVMASNKRGTAERLFVGSVAERVSQAAPAPTLIVRDAALIESWVAGGHALKVFVAVDFSQSANAPLLWIKDLQKIGRCSVTVAYVNWIPGETSRLGIVNQAALLKNAPDIQAILERDLHAKVAKLLGTSPVKVLIEPGWGRTDFHLVDMAKREEADLIVVGAHQHHGPKRFFAESVSRGVLHNAPMSVAIIPESIARDERPTELPKTKRVLVTTDFSDLGNNAIPYAYSLLSCGGDICIAYINERKGAGPAGKPAKADPQTRKWLEQLRGLIPKEAESLGIKTEVQVFEAKGAAEGVCQAAERFGADVICMGSHGRSGLSRAILGSVAHAVLERSSRPLLIVRPPRD